MTSTTFASLSAGVEPSFTGFLKLRPADAAPVARMLQQRLFANVGQVMLKNALDGYNTTLFAYGQTGSGKSYSVIGYGANKGRHFVSYGALVSPRNLGVSNWLARKPVPHFNVSFQDSTSQSWFGLPETRNRWTKIATHGAEGGDMPALHRRALRARFPAKNSVTVPGFCPAGRRRVARDSVNSDRVGLMSRRDRAQLLLRALPHPQRAQLQRPVPGVLVHDRNLQRNGARPARLGRRRPARPARTQSARTSQTRILRSVSFLSYTPYMGIYSI